MQIGLKRIDDAHDAPCGNRKFIMRDHQGHVRCFGQPRA